MKYNLLLLIVPVLAFSENKTDVSLFMDKAPDTQLTECASKSGDLYKKLGHHGPAIENEYVGYRMYFDKKTAIDLYSKPKPRLELKQTKWYSTPEQQNKGWGADHYFVGKTIGAGGVRLWDGEQIVPLHPVSKRSGRVSKEDDSSYLEILSEGVSYKGDKVDVLIRMTVTSSVREATVEVTALGDDEVQFVTGLNHREDETWFSKENFILSWAPTGGKVAVGKIDVGAAILFNPEDFEDRKDSDTQEVLISKPCKQLNYRITSANSEETAVNTLERFRTLVQGTESF